MTPAQQASLASSLKDNELFQQLLATRRAEALEALSVMKRDDDDTFHQSQAMVRLVDGISGDIERFVREASAAKKPIGLP